MFLDEIKGFPTVTIDPQGKTKIHGNPVSTIQWLLRYFFHLILFVALAKVRGSQSHEDRTSETHEYLYHTFCTNICMCFHWIAKNSVVAQLKLGLVILES